MLSNLPGKSFATFKKSKSVVYLFLHLSDKDNYQAKHRFKYLYWIITTIFWRKDKQIAFTHPTQSQSIKQ